MASMRRALYTSRRKTISISSLATGDVSEAHVTEPFVDKDALAEQILEVIISEGKIDRAKATPDATLESLEVQSIDVVMILMAIEEKFGVYVPIDGSIAETKNLGGFVKQIEHRILVERA